MNVLSIWVLRALRWRASSGPRGRCNMKPLLILSCALSVLLTSCGVEVFYIYYGARVSRDEFVAPVARDQQAVAGLIVPTTQPVDGAATMILPSRAYGSTHLPQLRMWEKRGPLNDRQAEESPGTFTEAELVRWPARADSVLKRRIFDTVAVVARDDPQASISATAFTLKLFGIPDNVQAVITDPVGARREGIAIDDAPSALPPVQRMTLWLDRIEAAASRI